MPHTTPSRPSRRERPAKAALTRESIVAAALTVLRSEGLDKLTMRRLAQELDTGAASLYVYVANTSELHALVLDEMLARVDLRGGRGDWRERLHRLLRSYLELLFAHPALARSALVTRPHGAHYLDLVEAVLRLLDEGGVAPERAAWGVDLLLLHATALAAEHGSRAAGIDEDDQWAGLQTAIASVDPQAYPVFASHGDDLLSGSGPERFAWGVDALLTGIAHTVRPHPGS